MYQIQHVEVGSNRGIFYGNIIYDDGPLAELIESYDVGSKTGFIALLSNNTQEYYNFLGLLKLKEIECGIPLIYGIGYDNLEVRLKESRAFAIKRYGVIISLEKELIIP